MRVKAVAHVRNEDMRRILKKPESEPGDVFDLEDGLAEVYLREGWVVAERVGAIHESPELAATAGALEQAISARGRRGGLTTQSIKNPQ